MKKQLTFLLALTFLFLFSSGVFGDDFQDGVDAVDRGDYKTAHRLWLPLAEQGIALAQVLLGVMYENGEGVPQDYQEAVKWYRLSAEQGYSCAQVNLGVMYDQGLGVPQDYILAHMWLNIAAGSARDKDTLTSRNIIEKKMTPSQIEEAQRLARNWKPKTK